MNPKQRMQWYRRLISVLERPDPDDRHVLATAIRTKAQVIVTFNEKHFPADTEDAAGVAGNINVKGPTPD